MFDHLLRMALDDPQDFNMPNATTAATTLTAPAVIYNHITSPFGKPWDFSQKADPECWLVASRAASDHVCFDVSVAMAETFMELLKDKGKYYCWNLLMLVPLDSNDTYGRLSNTLAIDDVMMKVNLRNHINLLTQWTKVSTARCQQFAQWYSGNDATRLNDKFKSNHTQHKVITLDCNANGNCDLVCQYNVQLCIINQLILHVLKNHLTTFSYKSFLAHQH